ncbi:MAG: PAS domain S-box protein [Deltaproteobacteria bacterium]|nr:PAS domain S-box protein [Deltaproteobacteria bacterium]
MNRDRVLAVLYDMAMVIGAEVEVRPLLVRTVQRLLHHTAFPVGLVLLAPGPPDGQEAEARLEVAIGDYQLGGRVGSRLRLPVELFTGEAALREAPALLESLSGPRCRYTSFLRLPVEGEGVILLLTTRGPGLDPLLAPVFQPVMANLARAIGLCRDHEAHEARLLAERDAARDGLAESAEVLRAMNQAALDAIIVCDGEGRIAAWNPAATAIFGYRADEVLGRPLHDLLAPERYRGRAAAGLRRFADAGEAPVMGRLQETEALRKDGSEFPVEISLSPMMLQGQRATVGIVRDASERKAVEEKLRRSQRLDALGQLASGVAHDFNNLLAVINGSAELAASSLPADAPQRADLEDILEAGGRAAALTRQLLAVGRRQTLNPVLLSLNQVVTDLGKLLRRALGEDVRLETRLAPDLGYVRADATQMEQVLMNLALNARDAMAAGGRLTIETANAEPHVGGPAPGVSERLTGPSVVLTVADTGSGMDQGTMDRMFEPFFTTKAAGRGTGLGLATVYGIVKQSGGHIEVESRVGVGTTFRVFLPRITGETSALETGSAAAMPGGSETILVVEDDPGVRRLAERVLASLGYRVLSAEEAPEALRLSEALGEPMHLLLTDMVMPGIDGVSLAQRMAKRHPGLAVVYMSGHPARTLEQRGGLPAGAPFLQKPFTASELARQVRRALDAARPRP